jgi:hypothetical protein
MRKIPTIFIRDMGRQPALVIHQWHPDCLWVRDGEGAATVKYDGTCCMVRDGKLYKRRELRQGDTPPPDFESTGTDENTGKTVGWVPVCDGPEDKYHREAFTALIADGTYELMGPKIQGNKSGYTKHTLVSHEHAERIEAPRTFDVLCAWLKDQNIEGVVWHHPDGRMAKIKRRDVGFKW